MGIDLATWRARVGLNYYHMCRPLQTRWRSSCGRLYQPGVASWGVGEVMNDTPLVLKSCMTVVALSLILQYVVHSWSKLKGRGGCGKVRCHWQGSTFRINGRVEGGGTLLHKAVVIVPPLLLVIAGDVETNPGPEEPSLRVLLNELHPVRASWYKIGLHLDIPHTTLDCFRQNYSDQTDLMCEMLKHWLETAVDPPPTWEAIVTALRSSIVDKKKVAEQLESKYCPPLQLTTEESTRPITVENSEGKTASKANEKGQSHVFSAPTSESTARCTSSITPPPSEGSQKPPFGCGCGKCSFLSLLESSCPTPIPLASCFPYLDISRLTHEQQQELETKLQFESQQIIMQFQKLLSATVKSLIRRNVSQDELLIHVMALGAFKPVFKESQVPAFHHCFKELKAADTIPKVFLVLKDYFSFFNYHIIEHIIIELGTEEDKTKLQRYIRDFNQYSKQRIFKCMPQFGPVSDSDHADVFVKLDSQYDDYTVAEIKRFCHKLSEILEISSQGILRLCRVDKGCLQLMFQVPSFIQHKIFILSKGQEEALVAMGVIRLTSGDYHFLRDGPSQAGLDKRDDPDSKTVSPRTFTGPKNTTISEKKEPSQLGVEKKHQHDPDDESGVGPSIFTDTKSTTFSEDRQEKEVMELDHELRAQGLEETPSTLWIVPRSRAQAVESAIILASGEYQFLKMKPLQARIVKKHQCDTDDSRDIVLSSTFTSTKSIAFFEDHYDKEVEEFDYELSVQGLLETASTHESGSNLELHLAIKMGQLEEVRFLVEKKHRKPMQRDQHGFAPIHVAAIVGNMQVFKYFLTECNCNPACPGPLGLTPLHLASEHGHLDVVKYLVIEQQIDPQCEDEFGNTSLHRACASNCQAVVEFLTSELVRYTPIHELVSELKNKWNSTPLHSAVTNGHLDVLRLFISDQNCDPNILGQHAETLLHWATGFGHLHVVKYLINEQGCDPSCLDEYKCTPLHCAAMNGHINVVMFLTMEKHCDPMCGDLNQNTPLHLAAQTGHLDIVKFFTVKMHCDPTSRNANNETALHLAAMKGQLDIIRFFISEQNYDPNLPGLLDRTPLHCAAFYGHLHIVKYLTDEQGCNPSCLDENRHTPLHCAAIKEHVDIVKFLTVEKHCNPYCRDYEQNTPLHKAAQNGQKDVIKFLTLEMHCDPTSRNVYSSNALHLAVMNGHLDIVQWFVSDQNCDPNIPGLYGRTPVHYAAEFGHLHIVKYLIDEQGCNPSCLDEYKDTPLHCAAMKGHVDIVKFLTVEKHCSARCKDDDQFTPLHTAIKHGHLEIVHFFVSNKNCHRGQYGRTPLHTAAEFGHLHIVKYLTDDQGCNPSCLDEDRYTPLHCAAMKGHVDIVKFLTLEKHCDPMCRDSEQYSTPLHMAAYNGHIEVVKFLTLEMHCDPTSRNAFNSTALHLAAMKGHLDIIRFLTTELNCDPNILGGPYGETPLHAAVAGGHLNIIKFLVEELKCPPDITGYLNMTPLQMAILRNHSDIAQYLQKRSVIPYIYTAMAMMKQLGLLK